MTCCLNSCDFIKDFSMWNNDKKPSWPLCHSSLAHDDFLPLVPLIAVVMCKGDLIKGTMSVFIKVLFGLCLNDGKQMQ